MTITFQKPAEPKTYDIGGTKYALPEGRDLISLSEFHVYAVTDAAQDRRVQPLGIIDSVQISAVRGGPEEQQKAVVDLLTRQGAKPVLANV